MAETLVPRGHCLHQRRRDGDAAPQACANSYFEMPPLAGLIATAGPTGAAHAAVITTDGWTPGQAAYAFVGSGPVVRLIIVVIDATKASTRAVSAKVSPANAFTCW